MAQFPPDEWFLPSPPDGGTDPFLPPEGEGYPTFAPNQPVPFQATPSSLPGFGGDPLVQPVGEQAQVLATGPLENPSGPQELGPADVGGPIPAAAPPNVDGDPFGQGSSSVSTEDGRGERLKTSSSVSGPSSQYEEAPFITPEQEAEYAKDFAPGLARQEGESGAAYDARMQAEIEKETASAHAGAIKQVQEDIDGTIEGRREALAAQAAAVAEARRLNIEQDKARVDPSHGIKNRSTMSTIAGAFAGALAGWLDVMSGGRSNFLNGVMGTIKAELDRDMEAQLANQRNSAYVAERATKESYQYAALADRYAQQHEALLKQAAGIEGVMMEAAKDKLAHPARLASAMKMGEQLANDRRLKASLAQQKQAEMTEKATYMRARDARRDGATADYRRQRLGLADAKFQDHLRKDEEDRTNELMFSSTPSGGRVKFHPRIDPKTRIHVNGAIQSTSAAVNSALDIQKYIQSESRLGRMIDKHTLRQMSVDAQVMFEGSYNQDLYGAPQKHDLEMSTKMIEDPYRFFSNADNVDKFVAHMERKANRLAKSVSANADEDATIDLRKAYEKSASSSSKVENTPDQPGLENDPTADLFDSEGNIK